MRLFVALELDERTRSGILEVVESLSSVHKNAKFVEPENLHFTLKFLGEVDEKDVTAVEEAIARSAGSTKSFRLHVHGLGYFGSRRFAKVVWAGTHEGREELVQLAKELDKNLSVFRKDERPPSPHITICRPKTGRGCGKSGETLKLIEYIEKEKSRDFGEMEAKSIKLKKSTLTPKGAVYEDLREFTLS